MNNPFSSIKVKRPDYSVFNHSHNSLVTMRFGELRPILCEELLPGDRIQVNTVPFVRFLGLLRPILQNVDVYVHTFVVPFRLLHNNGKKDSWENFISPRNGYFGEPETTAPCFTASQQHSFRVDMEDAESASSGLLAFLNATDSEDFHYDDSLLDSLGVNITESYVGSSVIDASGKLPNLYRIRAYNLIFDEFYKDENLYQPFGNPLSTAYDSDAADYYEELMCAGGAFDLDNMNSTEVKALKEFLKVKHRSYQPDYFTTALPWAQKGDVVRLPLEGTASIVAKTGADRNIELFGQYFSGSTYAGGDFIGPDPDNDNRLRIVSNNGVEKGQALGNITDYILDQYKVDLSTATAATIEELRRALDLEKFLELAAVGGTARYCEYIWAHFGVSTSDARINRPRYLGGCRFPVQVSEVLSTASTDDAEVGDQYGHAMAAGSTGNITFSSEEHCIFIQIMSLLPQQAYMQGISRHLTKLDPLDYYSPEFAQLGPQELFRSEVYNDVDPSTEDTVFGYQQRWAEYKFHPNEIHGAFRTSLADWHLTRIFDSPPELNSDFILCDEQKDGLDRIFVTQDGSAHIISQINFNESIVRPMPKFSL